MAGINKVILVGRLGKDPEVRYFADGKAVVNFRIATSIEWKDKNTGEKKEKTEWHGIVVYGKLGEICGEYLSKGRQVYVEGRLQTRSWEKDGVTRYITEIVASDVHFLDGRDASDSGRPSGGPPDAGARDPEGYPPGIPEDDIPF